MRQWDLTAPFSVSYPCLMRLLSPQPAVVSLRMIAILILVLGVDQSVGRIGGAPVVSVDATPPKNGFLPIVVERTPPSLKDTFGVDFPIPTTSVADVTPANFGRGRFCPPYTIRLLPPLAQRGSHAEIEEVVAATQQGCFPGIPALVWTGSRFRNCGELHTPPPQPLAESEDFIASLDSLSGLGLQSSTSSTGPSPLFFLMVLDPQ